MFLFGSNSTAIIYIYQQPAETISGWQKYLKKTSHTEGTGIHVYNMVHICSIMDVSPWGGKIPYLYCYEWTSIIVYELGVNVGSERKICENRSCRKHLAIWNGTFPEQ